MSLTANQKGFVAVGIVAVVVIGTYFGYQFYIKPKVNKAVDDLKLLENNTGLTANSKDILTIKFNEGENFAQFYANNRVVIFDKNNTIVVKGKYEDGGKKITLDNGKIISGGSVFQNLLDVLKS